MGARFARIYPLHFATIIWAFICSLIIFHYSTHLSPFLALIFKPDALPACLLLIQSMHIYLTPPLNTPLWLLSTEWWMYMVFPFLLPLFSKLSKANQVLITIVIIAGYILIRYVLGPNTYYKGGPMLSVMADFGFFRCLVGFCFGMLIYTYYKNNFGYSIFKKDWFFLVCPLGLFTAMHFGIVDLLIVAFFSFILIAASYNQTAVKKVLDIPILQRLGDSSFSIYMVHTPIIFSITTLKVIKHHTLLNYQAESTSQSSTQSSLPNLNYSYGAFMCIVLLILTITTAAFFYRFIEILARNYFNKIFKTDQKVISNTTTNI